MGKTNKAYKNNKKNQKAYRKKCNRNLKVCKNDNESSTYQAVLFQGKFIRDINDNIKRLTHTLEESSRMQTKTHLIP